MADLVNFSKSHLSKVERGKRPSVQLARACDRALHAEGALSSLAGPQTGTSAQGEESRAASPAATADTWSAPWTLHLSVDRGNDFMAFHPRALSDPTEKPAVMSWRLPEKPDGEGERSLALPHFRALFDECRALGQTLGPGVVSPLLVTATNALRTLAGTAPGAERSSLLRLAGRFAEYAGWMSQETGDDSAALWWTDQAAALAAACDDHDLVAYSLIRRAEIALYAEDSRGTVELALHAARQTDNPRVQGLAAQREAQGYALQGLDSACRHALDRAASLMSAASADGPPDPDGPPVLGSLHMDDPTGFVSGWCLLDLGRAEEAAGTLAAGLDTVPETARRARARHGARLALALADCGELEHACAVAAHVTASLPMVDSATIRSELRRLNRALNRWHHDPRVRSVTAGIAAVLHAEGPRPYGGTGVRGRAVF
ncbi:transcriptional regulator [Streptomyces sp. cg35]|uniref:transcriptional regulator n=1 Tax=Streptomyces sp. cg35 TaxID=3421650 RepID=UPI003D16ED63